MCPIDFLWDLSRGFEQARSLLVHLSVETICEFVWLDAQGRCLVEKSVRCNFLKFEDKKTSKISTKYSEYKMKNSFFH